MRDLTMKALIPAALVAWSGAAQAGSVQTLFFSGVIESYSGSAQPPFIDKYGLFGPAGADLTGAKITIFEQYAPAAFGSAKECGEACVYYDANAPASDLYGAILVVVTINGVQHTYTSAKNSSVAIEQVAGSNQYLSELTPTEFSGDYASVYALFPSTTTFKAPFPVTSISPSTPLMGSAYFPAGSSTGEDFPFQAARASH